MVMTFTFVLVLWGTYPMTMFYTDILSCVSDLDRYSRPPYNLRGDCMSWSAARQRNLVL
jgi:hypothetical protein